MELFYPVLLIGLALFLLYKYINRNHGYWRKKKVFSLDPLPIIGNFKDVLTGKYQLGEWFQWAYKLGEGKPYVGAYMFSTPILIIRDPHIIKDVLQKDFSIFDNRTFEIPEHDKVMCSMPFVAKNPSWKTIRHKITPTYTSGKLKAMFPIIRDIGESLKKYLRAHTHQELECREVASKYTNDVIAKTAFAVDAGCFKSENCEFRVFARKILEPQFISQMMMLFVPSLVKYFKPDAINMEARRFFEAVFEKTLEVREKSGAQGNDLVDILVALKQNDKSGMWDHEVLLAQALQVFFAGTETTALAISYTLHELALQPDIQENLRTELQTMLNENDGKIEYEPLLSNKYLDMCVSETLRKYPVLPFLDRQCNDNYTFKSTGLTIEKGTNVYIPVLALNYDEQYFPDPTKYDPERFRDMTKYNKDGLNHLPFGEGPRICIGERFGMISAKLALTHILTNFSVEPSENTKSVPPINKKLMFMIPLQGIPLKFKELS